MKWRAFLAFGVLVLLFYGFVKAYETIEVTKGGTISGAVKFSGDPPPRKKVEVNKDTQVCGQEEKWSEDLVVGESGGIKNAVVYIANIAKGKKIEPNKVILDQKGCWFHPHVLTFPAGSEVEILNPDGILHNFHTYSEMNPPVNKAQPKFRKKMTVKFEKPEIVKVTCDAHSWMSAWFVVQDHPYYAVTDENGSFQLTDVPPGDYELKVWHETLGEISQEVSVPPGGEVQVSFEMSLPS